MAAGFSIIAQASSPKHRRLNIVAFRSAQERFFRGAKGDDHPLFDGQRIPKDS